MKGPLVDLNPRPGFVPSHLSLDWLPLWKRLELGYDKTVPWALSTPALFLKVPSFLLSRHRRQSE